MSDDATGPVLRVVNSDATPEEVAAIVAVVSALQAPQPAPKKPTSTWAARQRRSRPPLRAGAGSWRASGLPR